MDLVIEMVVLGASRRGGVVLVSEDGQRLRLRLPEAARLEPWMDAARRAEKILVAVPEPFTDAENRRAAEDMAADMRGEIEG